ncbi:MAG: restriction endonuclease subunit S [Desulfuromonadaceae bacterium]|nr:restriction endonuclease subunit S [Desulfuromonadaceae bacterium]MDD2847201.1 restriction endonuclease subunit S [Desulfuromonadaceae bacterium]MDD4130145.1 restriction endonuclease subunit S [Desulfuromonadaceae bacterium]
MKVKLKNIATVQAGYSFRSRLESLESGSIAVIQMKDLTNANLVCCDEPARVEMEMPKAHHLLRPGDLIFRSRGLTSNSALLVDDPGIAVLAAPLLRIRLKGASVMPEYLNWYISQPPARSYLASCAEGTALKMISKQSLENLELFVPSLVRQRLVVEMAALAAEEQRILKALAEKRNTSISSTLLRVAQGE